jgi:Zn finger protein HypA/HybF involved in hydrogenase expression
MVPANFHPDAPEDLIPLYKAEMAYECISCEQTFDINQFLYTCPRCKSLLRIKKQNFLKA